MPRYKYVVIDGAIYRLSIKDFDKMKAAQEAMKANNNNKTQDDQNTVIAELVNKYIPIEPYAYCFMTE